MRTEKALRRLNRAIEEREEVDGRRADAVEQHHRRQVTMPKRVEHVDPAGGCPHVLAAIPVEAEARASEAIGEGEQGDHRIRGGSPVAVCTGCA